MMSENILSINEKLAPNNVANWGFIHSIVIFSTYSIILLNSQKYPVEKLNLVYSRPENTIYYFSNHKKKLFHEYND